MFARRTLTLPSPGGRGFSPPGTRRSKYTRITSKLQSRLEAGGLPYCDGM
jgi:hypothetical protein